MRVFLLISTCWQYLRHAKMSLPALVVVIPKEGWVQVVAAFFLLAWLRLVETIYIWNCHSQIYIKGLLGPFSTMRLTDMNCHELLIIWSTLSCKVHHIKCVHSSVTLIYFLHNFPHLAYRWALSYLIIMTNVLQKGARAGDCGLPEELGLQFLARSRHYSKLKVSDVEYQGPIITIVHRNILNACRYCLGHGSCSCTILIQMTIRESQRGGKRGFSF